LHGRCFVGLDVCDTQDDFGQESVRLESITENWKEIKAIEPLHVISKDFKVPYNVSYGTSFVMLIRFPGPTCKPKPKEL
jgi:hypothetical protein